MAKVVYTFTGTIEDGYNSTPQVITTDQSAEYLGTAFHQTGGTEAAAATYNIYRGATTDQLVASDTLTAGEVAGDYASDAPLRSVAMGGPFYWTAKADTASATLIGQWRHVFDIPGVEDDDVRVFAITGNPSDAA